MQINFSARKCAFTRENSGVDALSISGITPSTHLPQHVMALCVLEFEIPNLDRGIEPEAL